MSALGARLDAAISATRAHLLSLQTPEGGWWEGHLSSSAVSTATAAMALALTGDAMDRPLVEAAATWLARTQNADGGWGDTPDSPSNIAATLLGLCALTVARGANDARDRALQHLASLGAGDAHGIVRAIEQRYGSDRTFASPILAACALAGLVSWREVPALPLELTLVPRSLHRLLRLQVVSYALPALIAVGAAIHQRAPARNPLRRGLRALALRPALRLLPRLQPDSGGFLEAAPLSSFVAMTLAEVTGPDHEVAARARQFLRATVRADGSWPIDTNLSVWVTTNALAALRESGGIPAQVQECARRWLLERQHRDVHPFTGAQPGGWAWTHLPGGVPDADDTAGAVRVMAAMGETEAARVGLGWLVSLQNADGGWPTFCRGWGRLPFDRSSPDITAHALRALAAADDLVADDDPHVARFLELSLARSARDGFAYLASTQREDGSWSPLWFGNQHAPGQENSVYGTARVLTAYAECGRGTDAVAGSGLSYLLRAQNRDGGWGGAEGVASSVEETAVAVSALSRFVRSADVEGALARGVAHLLRRVGDGSWGEAAPIGLYFASLWYAEALYPVVWTVEALGRARETLVRGD